MFKCKIAGLVTEIYNRYEFTQKKCADYVCDSTLDSDIVITLSDEEFKQETERSNSRPESIEFLAIYRKLCAEISRFDAFLMHGAAIEVFGDGYIFCAPSGTGKTTHVRFWQQIFGDEVTVVNGDKPIIRFLDGVPHVFGTPWCGKENLNKNTSAPLENICFIHRSEENKVTSITTESALIQLMSQVLLPDSIEATLALSSMLDSLLSYCGKYDIYCNMSTDAAKLAYNTISKEKKA
jgi:hypothetical protein